MLKRLILNSAVFGIAPHLPKIISVFLLPILTRYLTDVDYGIIGTVTAYTGVLSAFLTLGLTQVLFNSFYHYKSQYKWLWRQLYGFLQMWIFIFTFIQAVVLYFVLPKDAEANKISIILLTSCTLIGSGTALLGTTYFQLKQTPLPIAIRTVILGGTTVLINYYLVVYLKLGYMGFFWATCISTVAINFSYLPFLYHKIKFTPIYRFNIKTILKALRVALPIIPHTYSAYMLNTSNRLVMDRYGVPMTTIGEFNIAQQFSNLMDSFTGAINLAINPMTLNEMRENNSQNVRKLIYIYIIITLSGTFLISLWLKEFFSILISNETLRGTYPYAIILIMAQNAKPMYVASSNVFFYYENTVQLLKITFVAGILSLIGYIVFIPIIGIWGAVVIYYIGMLYMGYAGFYFSFYKRHSIVSFPLIKIFVITLFSTFLVYFVADIPITYKIVLTLLFIAISCRFSYKQKLYKI